jgi:RHS repeat-associated protein
MESTSGVEDGILSLPQGGGAVRGLGDRFQPDLLRGSGNFSIPISALRGPNDLQPSLGLRYSTGAGNGPLGLGWRLTGPLEIRRRTDRGLPLYDDDRDEYVLGGAETLVHLGDGRYRPRADTQFWDIRQNGSSWAIRTKEGRTHLLGVDTGSRIAGPGGRVLAWLESTETDAAGNRIEYAYEYDAEQAYLASITWSGYELRCRYEDRPDVGHDGRGGFALRTARRLASIERRCSTEAQPLLARHDLVYTQAPASQLSLLTEVRLTGIAADGSEETYPSVKLRYSELAPRSAVLHQIAARVAAPPPLGSAGVALVDMDGDGLPDVLSTEDARHRWWPNEGDGGFGPPRTIRDVPAGMVVGRGGVTFADVRGDGAADLVRVDPRWSFAVENTGRGSWARPRVTTAQPALRLSATATRLVDLDGDGVSDLLQSTPSGFLLTYADAAGGWSRPTAVDRETDTSLFPDLALDDPGVELADMTGDGLRDLVFAASGRIEYWPYYGRGSWGPRVRTRNAPVLPAGFQQRRLFLTDVDGDGLADLLYVDADRLLVWINQSGQSWSDAYAVPIAAPPATSEVELCDFLGSGTAGILWSDLDRRGDATGYRYLDLGAGGKPYLLEQIDNGLGGLTEISYGTTSELRSADARAGAAWDTYLPFPVHVVTETRLTDQLTGRVTTTGMRYRRGVYDGIEREFRGFAEVEVQTSGDESTPTMVQVSSFDVGDLAGPTDALSATPEERARQRALSGSLVAVETLEVAADGTRTAIQSATMSWDARLEFGDGSHFVHFPRMTGLEARDHAPGDPDRIDAADYEHDAYGNLTRKKRTGQFDGEPDDEALVTDQRIAYTTNEEAWLVGLPVSTTTRDGHGRLLNETRHYYDGAPYEGLPAGQATRGLLTRTEELALADWALPDGYAEGIDGGWGFTHDGEGHYRTTVGYARDASGNVAGQRDGLGAEQAIEYDAAGLFPVKRTDSLGLVTEADFDARTGQPLEVRLPNGTLTRYRYSPIGRLRAQYDTASDGSIQLTQVFDVDYGDYSATPVRPSRATSLRITKSGHALEDFDDLADLDAVADADIACDYYDTNGNLLQRLRRAPPRADPARRWIVKQRRDWTTAGAAADYPNGFAADPGFQRALPAGPSVRFRYAGGGRIAVVEQPDGGHIRLSYGTSVRRRWMPSMADADTPISEHHDAWGRLVGVDEPLEPGVVASTHYMLDATDRPLEIIDAGGRASGRYVYGGPGPAIRIEHADAGTRTYWYDAAGRLRMRRDGLGSDIRFEYDGEGRMTQALDAGGAGAPQPVRTLTYDAARLVRVQGGGVDERFAYDGAGRLSSVTLDAGGHPLTVGREYGLAGELTAVVYPDGTRVVNTYDESLSLRSIDGYVDGIDYDAHGSPERIAFTGGASSTYVREPLMRRLRSAALTTAVGPVRSIELDYDAAGRITTWADDLAGTKLVRAFGYDAANRLIEAGMHSGDAAGPVVRDDHYAYSGAGDLLRDDESSSAAYVYGDAARTGLLTQVQHGGAPSTDIVYDGAARPTALGDVTDIAYDIWDRLVSATLADGRTVRFDYDHAGRRVRKTVHGPGGDELTHYAEALWESGSKGTRACIFAGQLLVAVQFAPAGADEGKTLAVLTDHLGSVLAACEADGAIVQQQVYSPYGLSLRPAGDHDAFTGVRADTELGLAQLGARYYAPGLGRFVTPDWWVIENPSRALPFPQSLNAFGYAVCNPLTFRDPTGMWFGIDDLIVAAAGFVVGFIAGTIYGLANGQGWSSLLTGLEAGLCGAAGAWLAWNTAGLALGLLGVSGGSTAGAAIMVGAAIAGGFNGVVSGMTQIYDWTSPVGWLSFLSDSSWGLIGTTLGDLLITVNLFYGSGAKYRDDLSRRQNRHVYDGGFGFGNFAFTEGNVTSNLNGRGSTNLADHEMLHITQNRIFGPIFTITYVAWLVVGAVVGGILGIFVNQKWTQSVEDVAYNDNPWESWAYDVGGSPTCGKLCWD